jgi:HK97 family phage prohead protease
MNEHPVERRTLPVDFHVHRSGDPDKKGVMVVRGHAAVFNSLSHDLGGFREMIAPGAFANVLAGGPDVHLLWDHDPGKALARTGSAKYPLELREDDDGLHFHAEVAPTSTAADLAVLLEGGVVDQASFAFTVAEDGTDWASDGDGTVVRTINEVDGLYDVTITAQGAYAATDSNLVALRARAAALAAGATPDESPDGGSDGSPVAHENGGAEPDPLAMLKASTQERLDRMRAEYQRLMKEIAS